MWCLSHLIININFYTVYYNVVMTAFTCSIYLINFLFSVLFVIYLNKIELNFIIDHLSVISILFVFYSFRRKRREIQMAPTAQAVLPQTS